MKYLLDTNVISESIKSTPNPAVIGKLEEHQNEVLTAAPVWHELQYGCWRLPPSRKREIIENFLIDVIRHHMIILPYDERAALWHAKERARLASDGYMPSFVDG